MVVEEGVKEEEGSGPLVVIRKTKTLKMMKSMEYIYLSIP